MKLDIRTMLVMLAVFALGYAVCLAMPVVKADVDRLEISEIMVDRIIVRESIEFTNGPKIYGYGTWLIVDGDVTAYGDIYATQAIQCEATMRAAGYQIDSVVVLDNSRTLKNVTIDPSVDGSSGLVGNFCNSDILIKPPPSR